MFRVCVIAVTLTLLIRSAIAVEPADVKPLDRAIADGLKEVHNRGADVHNSGDVIGAWRMYQGALISLKPLLAHRPDAQKAIDDGLKLAETRPMFDRSLTLSRTIAEVRKRVLGELTELHVPKVMPPNAPASTGPPVNSPSSFPNPAPVLGLTLWDRLGGEKRVEKVVNEWVTQAIADPKANLTRGGQFKIEGEALTNFRRRMVGYISSVSEGTVPFTGRSMKDSH